jgi:hypothetical protein
MTNHDQLLQMAERLAAALRAVTAERDALLDQSNHRGAVISLQRQRDALTAERDALRSVVRRVAGGGSFRPRTPAEAAAVAHATDNHTQPAHPTEGHTPDGR